MNGKILLDTNIVIGLFAGEPIIKKRLEQAEEVFVPIIVLGELYFGAQKSKYVDANIQKIDEFAISNAILGCDTETAQEYGVIKKGLKIKGGPIPENDIWIAAIAIQHDLELITRDSHFSEIDSLKITPW